MSQQTTEPMEQHELFELIRIFYRLEFVPVEELLGAMLNFYKGPGKGSTEDHSAYRPIELLNHSFKALGVVILFFLQEETDLGLSDRLSQEGYRRDRGGRCARLRLRMRIDVVLGLKIHGQAIMFEDMSSAFDKLTYSGIQDGLQVA